jgi:hypothetical protein
MKAKVRTLKSQGKYPKGADKKDSNKGYEKGMAKKDENKPVSRKEKFKAMLEKWKAKKKGKK